MSQEETLEARSPGRWRFVAFVLGEGGCVERNLMRPFFSSPPPPVPLTCPGGPFLSSPTPWCLSHALGVSCGCLSPRGPPAPEEKACSFVTPQCPIPHLAAGNRCSVQTPG